MTSLISIRAPASKSVTHRAFTLAALGTSPSSIQGGLFSHDTESTLKGLGVLGANYHVEGDVVQFNGGGLSPGEGETIDCGNSGTSLRLFLGIAGTAQVPIRLTGDASLRKRPNRPLADALRRVGVRIDGPGDRAPLCVQGPIQSRTVEVDASITSQFASSLAIALSQESGPAKLILVSDVVSKPYFDMSIRMLKRAGVPWEQADSDSRLYVKPGGVRIRGLGCYQVEGDWSSAAFLAVASALTSREVRLRGLRVDGLQGDSRMAHLLSEFGQRVQELDGDILITPRPISGPKEIDLRDTPDLFPPLCILAAAGANVVNLTGCPQLRHKESDRIKAMAAGLRALGISCTELPDGLSITPGVFKAGNVNPRGDHRIMMAFELVNRLMGVPVGLGDDDLSRVSYPGFYDDLGRFMTR